MAYGAGPCVAPVKIKLRAVSTWQQGAELSTLPCVHENVGRIGESLCRFCLVMSTTLTADTTTPTTVPKQQGVTVPTANSRFADDELVIDDNCTALGVPEGLSCVGFRQKQQRSTSVARCTDNNQTVRLYGTVPHASHAKARSRSWLI